MDLMSDRPVMNWEEDDRIRLACRLMERYSGRITGQEIAAQMNLGYEALRKQFRASTGISIGQYAIGIRVNRAKALLLEKLALQLGYPDCFSFCKQFKQHTGVSPNEYVIAQRISAACQLLSQTDKSVSAIAADVGYPDQYYFSRIFRKKMGIPPLKYRSQS